MKYCLVDGSRYPDERFKCRICGGELVHATELTSVPENQSGDLLQTACCPNPACSVLVAPAKVNFCAQCGAKLETISYELWLNKFVKPQLAHEPTRVLLDATSLFRPIAEMGLSRSEAAEHLDKLLTQETGVPRKEFAAWLYETTSSLESDASEEIRSEALAKADRLHIKQRYALAALDTISERVDRGAKAVARTETTAEKSAQTSAPSSTRKDVAGTTKPVKLDEPLKSSAMSFYRNFATGGEVSGSVTYLKAERARPGSLSEQIFLREIPSALGTFVLFRSDKEGWVFPNPRLAFRPEAFKILFPALTRHQFTSSKQAIDPVRVVLAGKGRWQLSLPRNGANAEEGGKQTAKEGSGFDHPVLEFPLSAAECEARLQGFAKVVRHDGFLQMLVEGPGGKGEFVVTTETGFAKNSNDLFVIPRIATFQESTYVNLYAGYYEGGTRQRGKAWILKPAIVDKVSGGWRLRETGVLHLGDKPKVVPRTPDRLKKPPLGITFDKSRSSEVTNKVVENKVVEKTKRWLVGSVLIAVGVVLLLLLIRLAFWTPNAPIEDKTMVRVSGGTFLMGSNDGEANERPQHSVTIKPFSIDKYEVTREEYEKFVKATAHPLPSDWTNGHFPVNTGRLPATGVDWYAAAAYCKWTGKRLPTEEEWEFAARGTDGRKYPWGNEWQAGFGNAENVASGLTDVNRFNGASPYGAIGMVGNAWEWTSSKLAPYPGGRIPPDEVGNGQADLRVIRGGSWQSKRTSATTTYRWGWPASGGSDYANTGFRCVKDSQAGQIK